MAIEHKGKEEVMTIDEVVQLLQFID